MPHNEKLRGLYRAPIIVRIMKPWRVRGSENVASIVETSNAYKILVGKPLKTSTCKIEKEMGGKH